MFSEAMREAIALSGVPLSSISKKSGLTYARIHDFSSGKREISSRNLSKIFQALPKKGKDKFSELILKSSEELENN